MNDVLTDIATKVLESYFCCWVEDGQPDPTSHYTDAVIEGLMNCCGIVQEALGLQDHLILPCYKGGAKAGDDGEYITDFALTTTYYNTRRGSAYLTNPSRRCGIVLTAESELGGWLDVNKIWEDFYKLTDIKAPIKVMVYTYAKKAMASIQYGFEKILVDHLCRDRTEKWLFLGLPWPGEWNDYSMATLEWDGDRPGVVPGGVVALCI